ncbi:MAG: site-specific DNA-methyltransferase [Desulfobacteraceae bacterium]|jgi:DNA modification methylase|nr:MAG: site-specific DNA-methyltransferase [Desulfobacteraceae bacterium]
METTHRIFFADARRMKAVADESIDLVVTSPPYPMIAMWDEIFCLADPKVGAALDQGDGNRAFELMHRRLDPVWDELFRVVKTGGFVCINIGDAVRTINDRFTLYPNHVRILNYLYEKGFNPLPAVIWRKQTNAPNKFMGAGMLPAGAYVTLEHEYILIVRKKDKRTFEQGAESLARQESAFFWEERNQWFSDVWMDLKGARQNTEDNALRDRSAAFPFDVPYRLIHMYSLMQDTVLDPFAGTGTTLVAAAAAGRNSIGYEIDGGFKDVIANRMESSAALSREYVHERLRTHMDFVQNRTKAKGPMKHANQHYGFPVMTAQEKNLRLPPASRVFRKQENLFVVDYDEHAGPGDFKDREVAGVVGLNGGKSGDPNRSGRKSGGKSGGKSVKKPCGKAEPAVKPMIQRLLFE